MIETIENLIASVDIKLALGIAALLGAGINAGISIYKKKKADKNFKFDIRRTIDTVWQSTLAGVGVAMGLGGGEASIIGCVFAMLTGIGIDTIANKTKILNIAEVTTNLLKKKK